MSQYDDEHNLGPACSVCGTQLSGTDSGNRCASAKGCEKRRRQRATHDQLRHLREELAAVEQSRDAIIALIQRLFDEAVRAVDEAEFTPGEFDLVDHKRLIGELLDAVKR